MSASSQRLVRVLGLFVLSILLLSSIRLASLAWNWPQFSHQAVAPILRAFSLGLRFDAAATAWLLAPCLLLALLPWPPARQALATRLQFGLFALIQIPFLALNLIDVEFVNFVGRRMTLDGIRQIEAGQGQLTGYGSSYPVLILLALVFIALLLAGSWKILRWTPQTPVFLYQGRGAQAMVALTLIVSLGVASRGGLMRKPVSFVDANVFSVPALNNLVMNTSFTVLKSLNQGRLARVHAFPSEEAMAGYLNGGEQAPSVLEGHRLRQPQNVVLIILESFGLEYMGEPNGRPGWTPFLDSMTHKGLFFRNGFANSRRSIEGMASITAGIPAMMDEPFINSPFTSNRFLGLGTLLEAKGYQTSFFHGGHNGTMHFDAFIRSAGIRNYYGFNEYPDKADQDGSWGIYDGPFFQWTRTRINAMKEPFFASCFSLSSHEPYRIPPALANQYPDGPLPILKAVRYSDDMLRRFFAAAEKEPWFHNTLFVLTADHTSVPLDPEGAPLSRYRVPILFYHPDFVWPENIDRDQIVQQIDIPSSILDFIGIKAGHSLPLARSVFIPGERTATLYGDGKYWLVAKDFFLSRLPGQAPRMFPLLHPQEKTPVLEPRARRELLEQRLKASIQAFSEGMWNNRLYVPDPAAKN